MKRLAIAWMGVMCLALASLAMGAEAMRSAEAEAWARQWLDASERASYQGTLVVNQRGNMATFALWHRGSDHSDSPPEERLRRQDGPLFEIIRSGDRITCLHAPGSNIPADHELPGSPLAQLMHLNPKVMAQNYQVTELPSERVAGRMAEVFELSPRTEEDRLIHRIWLDESAQVLLGHRSESPDGALLEEARFVVFEPGLTDMPRSIASRFRDAFWHRYQSRPAEHSSSADEVWALNPPAGFQQQVSEDRENGWYQMWSDGVVEFSVMVEPVRPGSAVNMADQRGSSVLVSAQHGEWLVVVVGDLPEDVAYQVLDRVSWHDD